MTEEGHPRWLRRGDESASSLLAKLRRKALLGTFLAATVVAGVAVGTLYPELRESPRQQLAHEAQMRVGAVEQFLAQLDEISRQITSRTAIREKLASYHHGEVDHAELTAFTDDKLTDALDEAQHVLGITRLDSQGNTVVSVGEPIVGPYRFDPGEIAEVGLEGPVKMAGHWRLVACAPIHEAGDWLGTDVVLFDLAALGEITGPTATPLGPVSARLIVHGAEGPESLFPEADDRLLDGDALKQVLPHDITGEGALTRQGATVSAYEPVPGIPMGVLLSIEASVLEAPLHRLLAALLAATVLLVLGIAWLLIRALNPLENRLRFQAEHDPLTNLPNRLLLTYRLQGALARAQAEGDRVALLYLDLDHFKNINDSLGHSVGDELLQRIGERLQSSLPRATTIARIGGDEFLLVMEHVTDPAEAQRFAQEVLDQLRQPFSASNWHNLYVGASLGISLYPDHGSDPGELITEADTAMYRAKEKGRNTCVVYRPELTAVASRRMDIEARLRRALERDEMRLHYQPQVDVATGLITGVEALLRWPDPEKGLIPPDQFIPIAEESGLIVQIGERVLRDACRQLIEWDRQGLPPLTMAVNLSPRQLALPELTESVLNILDETGIDPARLELEITESALMEHENELVHLLSRLNARGVRFAIDDFGTGYSSLAYLKQLQVDRLKVDRFFIDGLPDDASDVSIVTAIIAIARSLGLDVLAEGVAEEAQLRFIIEHGGNAWQGFLCSPARSPEEIAAMLADGDRDWRRARARAPAQT